MNSSYAIGSLEKLVSCFLVWGLFGTDLYAKSVGGRKKQTLAHLFPCTRLQKRTNNGLDTTKLPLKIKRQ